jgi:hypothetical protein
MPAIQNQGYDIYNIWIWWGIKARPGEILEKRVIGVKYVTIGFLKRKLGGIDINQI